MIFLEKKNSRIQLKKNGYSQLRWEYLIEWEEEKGREQKKKKKVMSCCELLYFSRIILRDPEDHTLFDLEDLVREYINSYY